MRIALAANDALACTCNALLVCWAVLQSLQSKHPALLPPMAASRDTALALSIAVLHQDSFRLANLPEGATPYDSHEIWPNSQSALTTMSDQTDCWANSTDEPDAAVSLDHPNVQSATTLLAIAAFCASQMPADIVSSSTTSSGSDDAAAEEQQACLAWAAAKKQQQQFQAVFAEHLEPTGVSLSAVAWAIVNSCRTDAQRAEECVRYATAAAAGHQLGRR